MMQHSIIELEGFHLAIRIPDTQVGVVSWLDRPFTWKAVEFRGIATGDSDEVEDADMAFFHAFEKEG
jgi:hypothetical protein